MIKKKILITGSSGFIGKSLLKTIDKKNNNIKCLLRSDKKNLKNIEKYVCKNFNNIKYSKILSGCNVVIHIAGYSNFTNQYSNKKQYDFNVNFTARLAQEAIKFGVKRFIFISSAKVNGDETEYNKKNTQI